MTDLQRAVDLAVPHQVPPHNPILPLVLRSLDILRKIESDVSKSDPLAFRTRRIFLQDL